MMMVLDLFTRDFRVRSVHYQKGGEFREKRAEWLIGHFVLGFGLKL